MGHREDLLAGARRCLEARGYARTTARDLVAESGTNLASIGYHFGSKEALLNEAVADMFEDWVDRVRVLTEAIAPARDPFSLMAASWSAMIAAFGEYRGLAVAFVEALAQAERSPQLREKLATAYERSRAAAAQLLVGALGVPDGPHARALASLQIAISDGLLAQWLLDPDATPSGAELAAALASIPGAERLRPQV
ncbi:TetR/AcrR family transcriptional regulator [Actinomycetes bacterium KLBMP 9759]